LGFAKLYAGENRFLNALLASSSLTKNSEIEVELDTRATDDGAKGQILANGSFGGSDFNVKLGFSGDLSKPADVPFVFNISLQNESPSILMQQFGVEALPLDILGQVKGPMKFNADLTGRTSSNLTSVIGLTAPGTIVSAQGDILTENWSEFDGELDITVASDDLAPLLVTAGMQMPGLNISDPLLVSSNFSLTASKGEFDIADLKGQVNGNTFSGDLKLQRDGFVRPKLTGNLEMDTASLPVIAESVFGHPSGLQNLVQQDSETNFGSAYFGGLDGNIKVQSDSFEFGGDVTGDNARTELVLRDGSLDINGLTMELFGGNFIGSFNLKNNEGVVLAGMQLGLAGADGKRITDKLSLGGFSRATVNLNGSAETSGRSLQALVANLTGHGIMDFENVGIEGLNPTNLEPILLETGAEDYEIKTENINALVGQYILNSEFSLSKIEAPFSINRGRVRVRNLTQSVGTTQLKGDLELDLSARSAKLMTELTFDPGRRERVKGVEPQLALVWEGPVGNTELEVDTDRLESFLSLRAFESSQRRVETLEAQVIEKQRLQRQIAFAFEREKFEERRRAEEVLRQQELERLRLEQEEEEARLKAEEEERKQQEEEARKEAERKQQEEQARQEAERKRQEEEARLKAEEEERKRQEEQARQETERKKQEEQARQEAERKRQEEQARHEEERKEQEELARQEAERQRLQELVEEQTEANSIPSNKLKPLGEPVAVGKHRNRIVVGEPGQPGVIENIEKFLETN
ncbi:MAG: AsmA-like C-terminal region-containing protein, partial [Pseudomonadota bacterium]